MQTQYPVGGRTPTRQTGGDQPRTASLLELLRDQAVAASRQYALQPEVPQATKVQHLLGLSPSVAKYLKTLSETVADLDSRLKHERSEKAERVQLLEQRLCTTVETLRKERETHATELKSLTEKVARCEGLIEAQKRHIESLTAQLEELRQQKRPVPPRQQQPVRRRPGPLPKAQAPPPPPPRQQQRPIRPLIRRSNEVDMRRTVPATTAGQPRLTARSRLRDELAFCEDIGRRLIGTAGAQAAPTTAPPEPRPCHRSSMVVSDQSSTRPPTRPRHSATSSFSKPAVVEDTPSFASSAPRDNSLDLRSIRLPTLRSLARAKELLKRQQWEEGQQSITTLAVKRTQRRSPTLAS